MDLLLLPGLLCDAAVWAPVVPRLEPSVRWQIPEYSNCRSLGAMAERVLAQAPPTFALAGHSMGGRVALEVVRMAPERVSHLALLDTGFKPRPADAAGDEEKVRRLALLALARSQGMRAMAEEWSRPMVHPSRIGDARLMDAILDMFERRTPDDFAGQIEALLARPDATALLRSIACPTLVLCGREDGWSTLRQHEEMASLIRGALLTVVEQCGHMAPMERPGEVGAALAGWLSRPASAGAMDSRMLPLQRA